MVPHTPDESADLEAALENKPTQSPVPAQRKGFLTRVRSLFGLQDPMQRPRSRRTRQPDYTPAYVRVETLPERVMLSATPGAIDLAQWNSPTNGAQAEVVPQAGTYFHDFDVSPDGSTFVTTNKNGSLTFFDATNGSTIQTVSDHSSYCNDVAYSPDGKSVAVAGSDKTVTLRDSQTGALLRTFTFSGNCGTVNFSGNGSKMAVGVYGQGVHVIDLASGSDLTIPYSGDAPLNALSNDGSMIAVSGNKSVVLYNTTNGQQIRTLSGLTDATYAIDVDVTGHYVAAGDNGGKVAVWDAATGEMKAMTADLRGKPSVAGGVRSVAFTPTGNALGAVDWQGNGVVYDLAGIATGNGMTVAKTFQTKGSGWGLEMTNKTLTTSGTTSNNVTTLQVFALPSQLIPPPPAPPEPPAIPVGQPQLQPEDLSQYSFVIDPSVLEGSDPIAPDMEEVLADLAQERMQALEVSIRTDAAALPGLLRQKAELERGITAGSPIIATQQTLTNQLESQYQVMQDYLTSLRTQFDQARHDGNGGLAQQLEQQITSKIQAMNGLAPTLNAALATLEQMLASNETEHTQLTSVTELIDTLYARLNDQCAEFTACAGLCDVTASVAEARGQALIREGVREGEDALPHVTPVASILDKDTGSGPLGIRVLDHLITEVRQHRSPIGVGQMKVSVRVSNGGTREGPITVTIGGVSDSHSGLYQPQTITLNLQPGESRDLVAQVSIPAGNNGTVWMEMKSPNENTVLQQFAFQKAQGHGIDGYIQGGEGAVRHNAEVIAMTEGVGTAQERLTKYLAANPAEAASIAAKISSGQIAQSTFTNQFLAAHQAAVTVAEGRAEEVLGAIDSMQTTGNLDADSLLLAKAAVDQLSTEGVRIDLGSALSFIRLERQLHTIAQSEIYTQVINRYHDLSSTTYPVIQNIAVRDDTAAGKVFMSVFQQGFGGTEDQMKLRLLELSSITGVNAQRIWLGMKNANAQEFFGALKTEFIRVGLGDIFVAPNTVQPLSSGQVSFSLLPGSPTAFTSGNVNLTWDIPVGKTVDHVAIYQTDLNGVQPLGNQDVPIMGDIQGTLTASIPVSAFHSSGQMKLKVAVFFTDGTSIGAVTTQSISVMPSTLQEGGAVRLSVSNDPVENAILNKLTGMDTFVVHGTGWRRTIASDHHLGNHLYAIDLNKGAGAEDDNEAVYTPIEADVESVDFDTSQGKSTVILKHSITVNGQTTSWFTKYLHMDKVGVFDTNGNLIGSLVKGMHLNARQRIGEVGAVGADGQVHLHLEILKTDGSLIDARNLLSQNGIQTKAWDPAGGGELSVEWDGDMNVWKGNEAKNAGLVFVTNANEFSSGQNNVWVAWDADPAKRGRVAWLKNTTTDEFVWVQVDNSGNTVITSTGKAKRWIDGNWEEITFQL